MPPHHPADPPGGPHAPVVFTPERLVMTQHDLRTPLAAVLGHAQLLRRHLARREDLPELTREQVDRHAAAIEAAARQLARAIDRLADPQDGDDRG